MSEMVDRVARAIFVAMGGHADEWLMYDDDVRDEYRAPARAAVEAMREPTEDMLDVGYENNGFIIYQLGPQRFGAGDAYRSMIDTALGQPENWIDFPPEWATFKR